VGEVDDKHTHPNPAMFAPIDGPEIKTSKLIDHLPNPTALDRPIRNIGYV
jgi:hypothetical protein